MTGKKVVAFFGLLVLFSSSLFAQTELVENGDFSNGAVNWNLGVYGGSASGSVVNGEYGIVVTGTGTEHWNVQFTQSGLALEQGKTYSFSFDAYKGPENPGAQSMEVNIAQSSSPWTSSRPSACSSHKRSRGGPR